MFRVGIPPPQPLLPYPNPNPGDERSFEDFLLHKINVINDLTRNPLSLKKMK